MNSKTRLGLELWKIYADAGRVLPATWIARAVRVSPTTMLRHLSGVYEARKGRTPERGWNWCRAVPARIVHVMETFISNGHRFETEEPGPDDCRTESNIEHSAREQSGDLLDYTTAILLAAEGMAMARTENCQRVIFRPTTNGPLHVGTMDDGGICTGVEEYRPTLQDLAGNDWMICAVQAKTG